MDRFTTMQTFLTVVDTGSFSNAARRLNVGQPAVSKTIAQLEERLGVKLLVRSTRGLAPTEAGHNFYERARRSLEEAEEADLAARGAGAGLSGKLRIGAAVTFARLHIVRRSPEFLAQNPELGNRGHPGRPEHRPGAGGHRRRPSHGIDAEFQSDNRERSDQARGRSWPPPTISRNWQADIPATWLPTSLLYRTTGGPMSGRSGETATEVSVNVNSRLRITAAEGIRAATSPGRAYRCGGMDVRT